MLIECRSKRRSRLVAKLENTTNGGTVGGSRFSVLNDNYREENGVNSGRIEGFDGGVSLGEKDLEADRVGGAFKAKGSRSGITKGKRVLIGGGLRSNANILKPSNKMGSSSSG